MLEDLKEALKTEPGNVTIKTELKRIDEVLSKTGQVNGKEGQNMNVSCLPCTKTVVDC